MRWSNLAGSVLLVASACGGRVARTSTIAPDDAGTSPIDATADGSVPCSQALCGAQCVDTSTDPLNCGSCGHDCLGGACAAGACQPVTVTSGHPFQFIVINSTTAFVASTTRIFAIPLATGTPTLLTEQQIQGLAVNDPDLFWVNDSGLWVARGGSASAISNVVPISPSVWPGNTGIAVDSLHVYWFQNGAESGAVLYSTLLDGSAVSTLPFVSGSDGRSLTSDGQAIYWATGNSLGRTALPAGSAVELVTNYDNDDYSNANELVATSGTSLYAASSQGLARLPKAGGPAVAIDRTRNAHCVAVDGQYVYWCSGSSGAILRATTAGSAPETFVTQDASQIAFDAVSVWWVNNGTGGTVMRLAK